MLISKFVIPTVSASRYENVVTILMNRHKSKHTKSIMNTSRLLHIVCILKVKLLSEVFGALTFGENTNIQFKVLKH